MKSYLNGIAIGRYQGVENHSGGSLNLTSRTLSLIELSPWTHQNDLVHLAEFEIPNILAKM